MNRDALRCRQGIAQLEKRDVRVLVHQLYEKGLIRRQLAPARVAQKVVCSPTTFILLTFSKGHSLKIHLLLPVPDIHGKRQSCWLTLTQLSKENEHELR